VLVPALLAAALTLGPAHADATSTPVPDQPAGAGMGLCLGILHVFWTAPADTAPPVASYTVTAEPSGSRTTVGAPATGMTFTPSADEATYSLVATNDAGDSEPVPLYEIPEPSSCTGPPDGAPDRPQDVVGVLYADDVPQHALAITWAAPDDHGSPVTSYTVTAEPSGTTYQVDPAKTSTTIITYPWKEYPDDAWYVVAHNARGDSAPAAVTLSGRDGEGCGVESGRLELHVRTVRAGHRAVIGVADTPGYGGRLVLRLRRTSGGFHQRMVVSVAAGQRRSVWSEPLEEAGHYRLAGILHPECGRPQRATRFFQVDSGR
jgi:hypothetical protein